LCHRAWLPVAALLVLLVASIYGIMHVNINVLRKPDPFETAIATWVRDWNVRRAAQKLGLQWWLMTHPVSPLEKGSTVWSARHADMADNMLRA